MTLCAYCGCCSANSDGSPGCIGTIPSGSHDGVEYLFRSRYMEWQNPHDPLIHSVPWRRAVKPRNTRNLSLPEGKE